MSAEQTCSNCSGKGYLLIRFPNVKEACFHCQGSGIIKGKSLDQV
ncbi:hypothetical protein [Mesobacillus harenae]|nr:hypothetical protein [Mesobacillus harenae]